MGSEAHAEPDHLPSLEGLDLAPLGHSRWFGGAGRIVFARAVDALALAEAGEAALVVADLTDERGGVDRYTLALRFDLGGPREALPDDPLWVALARRAAEPGLEIPTRARLLASDMSNTGIVLGEQIVLKLLRLAREGQSPEKELLQALDGVGGVPRYLGSLELAGGTAILLQSYIAHREGGWEWFIERVAELAAGADDTDLVRDAAELGALLARVHLALATRLGIEPAAAATLAARRGAAVARLEKLHAESDSEHQPALERASKVLTNALSALEDCGGEPLCRIHGDVHVGQVLRAVDGRLTLVDFDGEPGQDEAQRRAPWTPLHDVASLLLSFDNAAAAAGRRARKRGLDPTPLGAWADRARAAALEAWCAGVDGSSLRFHDGLFRAALADKQISELAYAVRFLPDWLYAPLEVLERRFT